MKFKARALFLPILSACCLVAWTGVALAQTAPVPGCNPKVLNAMQKKAEAQIAYDIAVTSEIIDQPDSVLAMTCFNKAAGTSAAKGGAIFSGDFSGGLGPVVSDSLSASYDDFGNALGKKTGSVDYSATALSNSTACDGIKNLWNAVKNQGVTQGVPYITFDNLVSGTAPAGAGSDFTKEWNAAGSGSQKVFANLKTALEDPAYPKPEVPSFAGAKTSCDVLKAANIVTECP